MGAYRVASVTRAGARLLRFSAFHAPATLSGTSSRTPRHPSQAQATRTINGSHPLWRFGHQYQHLGMPSSPCQTALNVDEFSSPHVQLNRALVARAAVFFRESQAVMRPWPESCQEPEAGLGLVCAAACGRGLLVTHRTWCARHPTAHASVCLSNFDSDPGC